MVRSKIYIRVTEMSKKHKEQDRSVSCNFFIVLLSIAGLVVTLQEWYRGDKSLFLYAFIASIVASGAEILINICLLCRKKLKGNESDDPFSSPCYIATVQILYFVGGCISFCMLVVALADSDGIENSEACGCANGFGCANILAICVCILYGFRILIIALCLPCILCAGCCACLLCFASAADQVDDQVVGPAANDECENLQQCPAAKDQNASDV